jgi:uncharacterized repeat protein (TIGR01451 family)
LFTDGEFASDTPEAPPASPWVVTNYLNSAAGFTPQSPQTLAGLNLQTGGTSQTIVENSPSGPLAETDTDLGTLASLRWPRYGNQMVSVNEQSMSNVQSQNANSLSQTGTVGSSDIDPIDSNVHLRFVFAPILQNPGLPEAEQPYYFIQLNDLTQSTVLYTDFAYAGQSGIPWQSVNTGSSNEIDYTDWQMVDVVGGTSGVQVGDQVQLQVIASGSQPGSQYGKVWFDGAGATIPGINVEASAPAQGTAGANLTYTLTYKNGASAQETNAVVTFVTPANTTFQSFSSSGSCTPPTVGQAGTVSCNLGALTPGASGSLTITVAVNDAAGSTTLVERDYGISSDQETTLLGPPVLTYMQNALQAPAITSYNNVNCSYNTGCTFTVTTTGNPTPSLIAGSLPSFASFTDNGNGTGTLTVAPASKGGYFNITFKASNGVAPNVFQGFRIYLTQAPIILSANAATFTVGSSGAVGVTANGYPIVALSETGALPTGLQFRDNHNDTASIIGTPAAGTGGSYSIAINGSNGLSPNASQNFTITVNQKPAITSANSVTSDPGVSSTFTVTTTGFPTSSLMEAGTLPSGVTFEDNGNGTATLSGTPAAGVSGSYPITITASNGVGAGATQKFTFGVLSAPKLVTPTPSSTLKSWTQLFQWSLGNEGVTQSSLQVGTTGAGSSNVYNGAMGAATSVTVKNIPLTAATLYVRLNYMLKGNPYYVDYQLTEASIVAPILQTPSSGATISGSTNFSWSAASPTPSEYELLLGTKGPGTSDLKLSEIPGSTTSATVSIPSKGAKVYMTLKYELDGTWYSESFTFTESH